ncbi:MAG: tyrosine-type recombinase/integrase [Desulfitobacteriia bacterium]|jgi:integrase/recombinase XerD
MNKNYTLRSLAEEFIIYKRRLGYIYETPCLYLMNYVKYAEKGRTGETLLDRESVKEYLDTLADVPGSLYGAATVLREFGRHLIKCGYTSIYIIPPKTVSLPTPEPPYFFAGEEIIRFFSKCDTIKPNPSFKGRELTLPVMFRVLYCCGMRCKEVRTLLCEDVHLDSGFLDVKQSKGPKSRRIYISSELADYLKKYECSISVLFPNRKYFFPSRESCYRTEVISKNFRRIWGQAYPNFIHGSRPRAYDFRHHFAWANLNRWAAEGLDVNAMLPYLMRYMGHQCISDTLYYFHFVPEFFPTYSDISRVTEDIIPEVPHEER